MRTTCYRCGYRAAQTDAHCPRCGAYQATLFGGMGKAFGKFGRSLSKEGRHLGNVTRSAVSDIARGGSSNGGCGPLLAGIGLFALLAMFWWVIVAVVIWMVVIAGLVAAFVALGRRFGYAQVTKWMAIVGFVVTATVYYVTHFVGDYEVTRSSRGCREEPDPVASGVSDFDVGDNLDCYGSGCRVVDTLFGRWVFVGNGGFFSDGEGCWMPYSGLRFQHGIVMSLVQRMSPEPTTDEEDAAALRRASDHAIAELRARGRRGDWEGVLKIGSNLRRANVPTTEEVEGIVADARSQATYRAWVTDARSASEDARVMLATAAGALPQPRAKPELDELLRGREDEKASRSMAALEAAMSSTSAPSDALLRILASLFDLHRLDPANTARRASAVSTFLGLVSASSDASPLRALSYVDRLAGVPGALDGSGSDSSMGALASRIREEASVARAAELSELVTSSRTEPGAALAGLCEAASLGHAVPGEEEIRAEIEPRARDAVARAAGRYVSAVASRNYRTWLELESLARGSSPMDERTLRTSSQGWLAAHPELDPHGLRWHASVTDIDRCGASATVALLSDVGGVATMVFRRAESGAWLPSTRFGQSIDPVGSAHDGHAPGGH